MIESFFLKRFTLTMEPILIVLLKIYLSKIEGPRPTRPPPVLPPIIIRIKKYNVLSRSPTYVLKHTSLFFLAGSTMQNSVFFHIPFQSSGALLLLHDVVWDSDSFFLFFTLT